jgi:hypothetical protein
LVAYVTCNIVRAPSRWLFLRPTTVGLACAHGVVIPYRPPDAGCGTPSAPALCELLTALTALTVYRWQR